jgi:hypothetical protein
MGRMKIKQKMWIVLLAVAMLLPCIQASAFEPEDGEPIEAAFTDAVFLQAVRELLGKTNGEHMYQADVEGVTELVVNGYNRYNKEKPVIESLDGIEYFTGLEKLDCGNNELHTLDLSHNPNLKEVACYGNYLITLDLSHNPKLEVLDCSYNYLTSLDLSNCPELRALDCNDTDLQELDVSQNTKLTALLCWETNLTSLDVSNNPLLEKLEAWGGHLVNLDVSNNTRLKYLDCGFNDMCAVDSIRGLENCTELKADAFFFEPQNGPTGQHTPGTDWQTDGLSHWHTCTVCGAEGDRADHVYDHDQDAVCDTCGYTRAIAPPVTPTPSGSVGSSYSYYAITATAGEGGRIDPGGRVSVREGGDKVFTITPGEGYEIADVLVDGKSVGAVAEYGFEEVSKAHTIEAAFRQAVPGRALCPKDESCPIWSYTDADAGEWYHDGVHYCMEKGLMLGYGHGKFGPSDPLTRGMAVQILYNEAGRPAVSGSSPFDDVSGEKYYAKAVVWASGNGLVNGFGDGTFRPDEPVTREQIAAILYRHTACKGGSVTARADLSGFPDAGQISGYAREPLAWAKAEGLINGADWGGLHPGASATRAETAEILSRFCRR